jgi:hypothetical protein
VLRNDVLSALERGDAVTARLALARLEAAWVDAQVDAPRSSTLRVLIDALENRPALPSDSHAQLGWHRRTLLDTVEPAAIDSFGAAAGRAWMQPLWSSLAESGARIEFSPAQAEEHAAPLWLMAGRIDEAARAVETIASWRRMPAPLSWMLEAQCRSGRIDDAWPLLAELAWLAPARLDALLRRIDDPLLRRLHQRFGSRFEGQGTVDDLSWFPAWLLIDTPALASRLAAAWNSQHREPERAMRLLVELIGLERQGRQQAVAAKRRALRDLHPALYADYLAMR